MLSILNNFIIVRWINKKSVTIQANSTFSILYVPEEVAGYKPFLGLYNTAYQGSGNILPYQPSSMMTEDGEFMFKLKNLSSSNITSDIAALILCERLV